MKATVKVYENGREIFAKVFDEGVYRAGRSDFSDIPLLHDGVSRSHLELRVTEATIYMTNMSTAGRVKLNGKPKETSEIADGDEITIGPFKIIVFHGEKDIGAAAGESQPPDAKPADAALSDLGGAENGGLVDGGGGLNDLNAGDVAGGAAAIDVGGGVAEMEAPAPAESPVAGGTNQSSMNRSETEVEIRPLVAKLIFTEGPRENEEIPIETYEVTFGRSKRADIYLDDDKLSRIHAKITRVGMGYRLIDMNSRNGTYVNGMRVLEHPLSSFDQIEIGRSKMKFLIHDMVSGSVGGGGKLAPIGGQATLANASVDEQPVFEQTRSMQIDAIPDEVLMDMQQQPNVPPPMYPGEFVPEGGLPQARKNGLRKLLIGALAVLIVLYFVLPAGTNNGKPVGKDGKPVEETAQKSTPADVKLPALMPKEYMELSPELQRMVEGHYNSAQKAAELFQYEEAVGHLRKIHDYLPYYKQSRELLDQYSKKVKEKQIADAQEKAKKDEKQDLQIYLDEGQEYLKEGDFERAAESFNSAIVIDPTNQLAVKGLKAAELKVRSVDEIPPDKDPEQDKRKLVAELFQKAVAAFTNKSYQEAIDTADRIRQIELKGDTQYLNEAKQIIDRARMLQKDEFEPFLIQAKEKYAEGDYNASRDLCEEMLKRDAAYEEAKECVTKAKKQLNRLAKEAYTHGYILESMNRIEEAKQYWNRAKNYVRTGDDYFDKINRKLDYYQ